MDKLTKEEKHILSLDMRIKTPVNSSNIKSVNYREAGVMEIEFHAIKDKPIGIYRYWPIPLQTYHEMIKAKSVGTYFFNNIRNNKEIKCIRVPVKPK